jgi:hypothetical protein
LYDETEQWEYFNGWYFTPAKNEMRWGIVMYSEYKPKQPKKCHNCIWGRWDGMKQFCSKPICIKATPIVETPQMIGLKENAP